MTLELIDDTTGPFASLFPAAARQLAELEAKAERHETEFEGGKVVWRRWGDGPDLVLLHGGFGSWAHWIRNIPALAAHRRVWAPDLPGFGDSASAPDRDSPASVAAVLVEGLVRLIGPDAGADLVGFSTGGVVGAHVAAQAPTLIRRLILVDSGGLATPMGLGDTRSMRGLSGEALAEVHRFNLGVRMIHDPAAIDDLAVLIQATNVPKGRASTRDLVLPQKLLDVLPQVRARIDVIWGEHDAPHPDPAAQYAVIRLSHPQARLRVIKNAGHWAMYEGAEAFNAAALDLLAT